MWKKLTIIALFLCFSDFSFSQQSDSTILLLGAPRTANSMYGKLLKSIYTEAFKRIAVSFEYQGCVPNKCTEYVLNGSLDGEMARFDGYNNSYPFLIQINEPVLYLNISAFSIKNIGDITDWDSFKQKKYRTAVINGYKLLEEKLNSFLESKHLITISSTIEGLNKLLHDKIDILIDVEGTVLFEKKEVHSSVKKISSLEKDLPLYCFLHKKHISIAKNLENAFKKMRSDGTFKRIYNDAEILK